MAYFPDYGSLIEVVSGQAASLMDKKSMTFLAEDGSVEGDLTFQDLDTASRKVAAGLVEKGIAGRNLVLLYAPGIEYIKAFFGCLYAGCVPVPAYPPMGAKDIDRLLRIVRDCDAAAILSSSMIMPMIEAWISSPSNGFSLPCIATDTMAQKQDITGFDAYKAAPSDIAFLQYTSGSTGHPKGVMISHENLIANFQQILHVFTKDVSYEEMGQFYRTVIWLPPFHDMGLIGGILTPLYIGAEVSLMSPLTFLKNPFLWLKTISDEKAMVSGGPNFAYQYCARKVTDEQVAQLDLSTWGVAFNGAEPIQLDSLKAFSDRFTPAGFNSDAFLPCYGLAEATLFVAGTPAKSGTKVLDASLKELEKGKISGAVAEGIDKKDIAKLVSSGVVAHGADVRIVDPQNHTLCEEGEVGEIWVNSPSVAQGYWNKPAFSDSVFRARIKGQDNKAFMRTGDLGIFWNNELFVTGRIKELIIVAGKNHYPQDIEMSLQKSNPLFRKGCGAAFSIALNGKEELVVMQEVASAAGKDTDFKQLALSSSKAIASRHGITPKSIVFIAAGTLPKTSSGKIQRTEAKKVYEQGSIAPLHAWMAAEKNTGASSRRAAISDETITDWQSELYCEMQSWVSDKLNVETHHIDLDVTFSELGVDSIEAIDLIDRLQNRISRSIPATELMRYPTVKALINHFATELTNKDFEVSNQDSDGAPTKKLG